MEDPGGKTVSFNVSHSNGLAIYAVSSHMKIEIDLEYICTGFPAQTIAEQFFSPCEIATLNALPEDIRQKAFFTYWARKEACLKAEGMGLALDPLPSRDLTVSLNAGS